MGEEREREKEIKRKKGRMVTRDMMVFEKKKKEKKDGGEEGKNTW